MSKTLAEVLEGLYVDEERNLIIPAEEVWMSFIQSFSHIPPPPKNKRRTRIQIIKERIEKK